MHQANHLRNSKKGIKSLVGKAVFELLIKICVFRSITQKPCGMWPTEILMSFLSFLDTLLQDTHIIFQKQYYFEMVHRTSAVLVWGAVPC